MDASHNSFWGNHVHALGATCSKTSPSSCGRASSRERAVWSSHGRRRRRSRVRHAYHLRPGNSPPPAPSAAAGAAAAALLVGAAVRAANSQQPVPGA
eukprot:1644778-Prymnesium_polylepis.1